MALTDLAVLVRAVLTAAPLAVAHGQPVGRLVAGAQELFGVHEALEQPGPVAVLRLVVGRHGARGHAQHARGQVVAAHRAADQEARHAHHAVKMLASSGCVPTDPAVAVGQVQRRGGEAKAAEPAVLGLDQVAQLRAHQRPGSLRMLAGHQLVPQPQLLQALDLDQRQAPHVASQCGHVMRLGHRHAQAPRRPELARATASGSGCGQHEVARVLEFAQCLDAAGGLRAAAGIDKAEVPADRMHQRRAIGLRAVGQQAPNCLDRFRSC